MKQLHLKLKNKQLNGTISALELDLQTLQPVTILAVKFDMPARLVVCQDKATRDKLVSSGYQMMTPEPAGVLLHIASNVIWSYFDLTKLHVGDAQAMYFRYPKTWQPVTVQASDGKLFCMIEARSGNAKHKAEIGITLYIK